MNLTKSEENRWNEVSNRFFNGYPNWLNEEKELRRATPVYTEEFRPVYTEVGFITPTGKIEAFRYYQSRFRTKLSFEDFANCVRSLEDRYMIFLPKSSFLSEMVEAINPADLARIRQKLHKRVKMMQKKKETDENTKN